MIIFEISYTRAALELTALILLCTMLLQLSERFLTVLGYKFKKILHWNSPKSEHNCYQQHNIWQYISDVGGVM